MHRWMPRWWLYRGYPDALATKNIFAIGFAWWSLNIGATWELPRQIKVLDGRDAMLCEFRLSLLGVILMWQWVRPYKSHEIDLLYMDPKNT